MLIMLRMMMILNIDNPILAIQLDIKPANPSILNVDDITYLVNKTENDDVGKYFNFDLKYTIKSLELFINHGFSYSSVSIYLPMTK